MPYFSYEARERSGKLVKDQAFSSTTQELLSRLHREGLLVLNIRETASIAEYKRKLHKKAKTRDLILFASEMKVLLENGIPIIEALDVILKQMTSSDLISAVTKIRKDLEGGSMLYAAIAKHPKTFGNMWEYLVEAGETSGQMPFVMEQISVLLETMEQIRNKTINAMIYPSILAIVATAAVLIFTLKIIPIFKGVYMTLGSRQLPALTTMVFSISDAVRYHYFYIFLFIVALVLILRQVISTRGGRRAYENVILSTPALGNLYLAVAIEKFSTTLKVLLNSGILIIKSMDMASNTAQSLVFSEKIAEVKAKVTAGLPFSDALQQTGFFPPLVVQLVAVGERTGNFPGMFDEISKYYHDIIDNAITRFTSLIEPIMLIIMAVIIGTLVIAMFLPIFKLANL